jgi:hypothetical protein
VLSGFEQLVVRALAAKSSAIRTPIGVNRDEQLIFRRRGSSVGTAAHHRHRRHPIDSLFSNRAVSRSEGLARSSGSRDACQVRCRTTPFTLAVIACLLELNEFSNLARTKPHLRAPNRYLEILRLLGCTRGELLLSRMHRGPPALRQAMTRAVLKRTFA